MDADQNESPMQSSERPDSIAPAQQPAAINDSAQEASIPTPASSTQPSVPATESKSKSLIYHGPVSLWMGWRALTGASLAGLSGAIILFIGTSQPPGIGKKILVIGGGALLASSALMIPYLIFSIRCLTYKISDTLVERERGLLFKRVDSLDLGRIKDVQLRQNVLQRMLKIGTIEIYSSDQSDPHMLIEDIPSPRDVYEQLRNAMIQHTQKRSIMFLER